MAGMIVYGWLADRFAIPRMAKGWNLPISAGLKPRSAR
jgi:hypothetical protein